MPQTTEVFSSCAIVVQRASFSANIFSEDEIEIPDIEAPLHDLTIEVGHDLGGANVLLLHQLAHLQVFLLVQAKFLAMMVEPVFSRGA